MLYKLKFQFFNKLNIKCRRFQLILQSIAVEINLTITMKTTYLQLETRIIYYRNIFTFSSHTEYVKRESIVIAWVKKKNSLLLMNVHDLYVLETKQAKKISVCLSVWLYVRTWTFHVDTITFEGISKSKQNLVGVFYVWNVGLVLKSKVKSWSWSKSWSWTEFWFSQKLSGVTPNLVDIFSV